ncbi:hypothetical protein ACVWZ4_001890 [Bradyrhizobium sp. USDA 4472]
MYSGATTVVLPCPPDHFSDFIAGLLGRAQTIETVVDGPFEINREGVENLFHLIKQRISSQNDATLVQFTARIIYDDKSSVLLNSLPEFLTYNEVRPLVSQGLHLSWTYLIKFQNKPYPEKQVIVISFDTTGRDASLHGVGTVRLIFDEPSVVRLRIEHTDRTWGADMEALLRGQLEMLRRPISAARSFSNDHSGWIGLAAGLVAGLLTLVASYRISSEFALSQLTKLSEALKDIAPNEQLARRLAFLTDLVTSGIWTRFTLFAAVLLVVLIVGSVVLGALIAEQAHVRVPSFILLTSRSKESKEKALQKLKNSWYSLAGSFLGALALGLISNGVFYLALKYLGLPS